MAKFRKKPVVVEVQQFNFSRGHSPEGVVDLIASGHNICGKDGKCKHCGEDGLAHGWINTLEGGHIVCPGDMVITGLAGEKYPCKPDRFKELYDRVGDEVSVAAKGTPVDLTPTEKAVLASHSEIMRSMELLHRDVRSIGSCHAFNLKYLRNIEAITTRTEARLEKIVGLVLGKDGLPFGGPPVPIPCEDGWPFDVPSVSDDKLPEKPTEGWDKGLVYDKGPTAFGPINSDGLGRQKAFNTESEEPLPVAPVATGPMGQRIPTKEELEIPGPGESRVVGTSFTDQPSPLTPEEMKAMKPVDEVVDESQTEPKGGINDPVIIGAKIRELNTVGSLTPEEFDDAAGLPRAPNKNVEGSDAE